MQQQQYGQPPRPAGVREGAMFNQQRNRYELPGGSVAGLNAFNDQAGVRPGAMFNQQRSRWELPGGSAASMQKQQAAGQWPQTGQQQAGGINGGMGGQQQQPLGGMGGQPTPGFSISPQAKANLNSGVYGGNPMGGNAITQQPQQQQMGGGMGGQLNPQQFQQFQQWLQSPQGQQLAQLLMGGGQGGGWGGQNPRAMGGFDN